jgi:hypothetical protein
VRLSNFRREEEAGHKTIAHGSSLLRIKRYSLENIHFGPLENCLCWSSLALAKATRAFASQTKMKTQSIATRPSRRQRIGAFIPRLRRETASAMPHGFHRLSPPEAS